MKLGNIEIPAILYYTPTHLWVRADNGLGVIGWTDYIQSNAGDVNYIDLPAAGTLLEAGQEFGSIETSKWVDKLYAPVGGRVAAVNPALAERPELINESPFDDGWFVKIAPRDATEGCGLMTSRAYFEYLQTCEV